MFLLYLFTFITTIVPLFCMDKVCQNMGALPANSESKKSSEIFDDYSYTINNDQIEYQELNANKILSNSYMSHDNDKKTPGAVTFSFEDVSTPTSLFGQNFGKKRITINKCQATGNCDTVLFTDPDLLNSRTKKIQSESYINYAQFTPLDEATATQVPYINRYFRDKTYNLLEESECNTDNLSIAEIKDAQILFGCKNDFGLYPLLQRVTATQYYVPVQDLLKTYESHLTQTIITKGLTAAILQAHNHNLEKKPENRRPLIIPASSLAQFGNSSVGVFAALQNPLVQQCVHNGQDLHIIFKTDSELLTVAQNVLNVPDKRIEEQSLFDTLNQNTDSLNNERIFYYDIKRVLNYTQKEVFIPHIATFLIQRALKNELTVYNPNIQTILQKKLDHLHTALDYHCHITSNNKATYFLGFFTSLFKWAFAAIRFQDCTQIKKTTQYSFRILYQKWLNSRGKYDPETLYFNDPLWH